MAVESSSDFASYMDDWGDAFEIFGVTVYGELTLAGSTQSGVSSYAAVLRISDADVTTLGLIVGHSFQIGTTLYEVAEIERDGDGADFPRIRLVEL